MLNSKDFGLAKHQYEAYANYRFRDFRWQLGEEAFPLTSEILWASGSQVGRRMDAFIVVKHADGSLAFGLKDSWYEHNWELIPTTLSQLDTLLRLACKTRKQTTLYWWREKFKEFLDEQRAGNEERTGVPQRTDEAVS